MSISGLTSSNIEMEYLTLSSDVLIVLATSSIYDSFYFRNVEIGLLYVNKATKVP